MSGSFSLFDDEDTGADFSECGRYRYRLWRRWDPDKPVLGLGLMNPSTAGVVDNDNTVSGQCTRARMLGFGGIDLVNAFAFVETDSTKLAGHVAAGVDIIGPRNDAVILKVATECSLFICGWGVPGHVLLGRGPQILEMLRCAGVVPHALQLNADGSPKHPLYIRYGATPVPF